MVFAFVLVMSQQDDVDVDSDFLELDFDSEGMSRMAIFAYNETNKKYRALKNYRWSW